VDYAAQVLELLHHVTETNITVADSVLSLNGIHTHKKLNELEFDFNVLPFAPDAINQLSTAEVPIQIRYAKELEGIMNGKIDLFFEHAGKYYILDWKSNYLGDGPTDYSKENVVLAMAESNYHLQYLIYTIAVKKYLQLRVPAFDYATHFGGVIYLFVRGVRMDNNLGIFTYRPGKRLIDELEHLLSKPLAEMID
jgi:exodeoxyribonuclease V beta subunit